MEMDPWVVSDVLRPNLEWTGFLDNAVIHTVRVETYLERTKDAPFDYISVTPPYMLVDYEILMKQISESSVIGDDSFVVGYLFFLILFYLSIVFFHIQIASVSYPRLSLYRLWSIRFELTCWKHVGAL